MAKFRVGQRVKIVNNFGASTAAWTIGIEGKITCTDYPNGRGFTYQIDEVNRKLEYPVSAMTFREDELEPLKYDGNEVVSWDTLKKLGLNLDIGELV